jgi:DegV family protein with EDD domain
LVAVVVDSAGNVPADLARQLGIVVVPMYLRFGDAVYRDGVDLTPTDFYQRLLRDREPASTSTPSPGDYLEGWGRLGQSEVVCVTVAAGLSSSYQQAALAAERFPGRVELVDSANASMGEGFVAVEAARLAATGASLEEVASRAREVAARAALVATVETFEFLRMSGRVTKLQAYAATMLDIKPVFRFRGGEIVPVARPRTRRRALARVVDETLAATEGRPVHLAVFHAAAAAEASEVFERVAAAAEVLERFLVEVTPVIGAHTGPGLVGTAFFTEDSSPGGLD